MLILFARCQTTGGRDEPLWPDVSFVAGTETSSPESFRREEKQAESHENTGILCSQDVFSVLARRKITKIFS
jgi:hypothetical protein